jgi:hypothetical protein
MESSTGLSAQVLVPEKLGFGTLQSGMRYDDKVHEFMPSGIGLPENRDGLRG